MNLRSQKSKAQSFIEYAMLIAVAAIALLAMKIYISRIIQEKYRQAADEFGRGEQYQRGQTVVTEE